MFDEFFLDRKMKQPIPEHKYPGFLQIHGLGMQYQQTPA